MLYINKIPEKTLNRLNQKNIYDGKAPVLFFYDDTVFLSGNKGILCTQEALVVFNKKSKQKFLFSDFTKLLFQETDKTNYIFKMVIVFPNGKELDITPKSIPNDEMRLMVDMVNRNK